LEGCILEKALKKLEKTARKVLQEIEKRKEEKKPEGTRRWAAAIILGLVIVAGLGILVPVGIHYGFGYLELALPAQLTVLIFLGIALTWILKSIKGIPPTEMGVLVVFNKAVRFVDSGLKFVPWLPTCYIKRFPKKLYRLDFRGRRVITKTGTYDKKEYTAQEITVDSTLYFRFPRNDNLITTFESKIQTKQEALTRFWEDTVVGALRAALGKRTWREVTEKQEEFAREVKEIIADSDQFKQTGIRAEDLIFVIEEVHLPTVLTAGMAEVDRQRMEAQIKRAVEKRERAAERIELRHVRDRAIEIRDGVGLSPKDAIEVVQTERGKVTKHIIEYKGLEGIRGLPLINIGGERILRERRPSRKRRERSKRKKLSKEEHDRILSEALKEAGLK
jgi:regulator of protease activity HflC (stomatin/prohibitin superfamily)